jgi:hypothetical protein
VQNQTAAMEDQNQREKQIATDILLENQIQKEKQSSEKERTQQKEEHRSSEMNDDITTYYDGRCFIHLLGDVYVVAKEFNKNMLIHIRHYDETRQKKIPTKKGVTFNLSRWLLLETIRMR